MPDPSRPKIFIDADVLMAGSASPNEHSASNLLLRMAELTLVEAITCSQVIAESERNLASRMPRALPAFQVLVSRCLRIAADPSSQTVAEYSGLAHPKDLPILVSAVQEGCILLATFNLRHYDPGHPRVKVMKPGDVVLQVRHLLAHLG